jgi:hypothetical protein
MMEKPDPSVGRVIQDYEAVYSNGLFLKAGDCVACGMIDPDWPGWIRCKGSSGRKAWVPERIIERVPGSADGRLLEDYESTELTAKTGETLTILKSESGWAWAENETGLRGWIPESFIERMNG